MNNLQRPGADSKMRHSLLVNTILMFVYRTDLIFSGHLY